MPPVFFIGKKNVKKYMVQNYQYLNEWTVKNNYHLPLISDLDLWWEYNNVWIKKRDEWKVVFMTPKELFELMVIFFGLMNSLMTFQTMINEILWNLINTEAVRNFINDIIVETKKEERHDKVVEEVVKRLAKNDLYIKLEKCKWKVRKVEFLEVVIELEGIKIEKEKVKVVLD